uniref:Uncharacterized protein n=1 Tax=uncultured bacterium pBC1 TaxID=1781160 RepID=A0A1C9U518_9BACT|nr:hypothetical protein [uncultured bacterium pBC1]
MLITNLDSDCGYTNDFISIDLSNPIDPNRILDIFGRFNPSTNEYEYSIQAQWIDDEIPVLKMDEKLFLDFADAIHKTAAKILNR